MDTQTAIIVPVAAADPVVEPYRRALDHSAAWGVPAHVTALYPFVPPARLDAGVVEAAREVAAGVSAFDCVFERVEWFGADVVWLAPEPAEPFRELTHALWRRFPACPPYGGEFPDPVPHLTVGSTRLGDLPALRVAADELRGELPFSARVDRALLISGSDATGSWWTVAELPLRPCTG